MVKVKADGVQILLAVITKKKKKLKGNENSEWAQVHIYIYKYIIGHYYPTARITT